MEHFIIKRIADLEKRLTHKIPLDELVFLTLIGLDTKHAAGAFRLYQELLKASENCKAHPNEFILGKWLSDQKKTGYLAWREQAITHKPSDDENRAAYSKIESLVEKHLGSADLIQPLAVMLEAHENEKRFGEVGFAIHPFRIGMGVREIFRGSSKETSSLSAAMALLHDVYESPKYETNSSKLEKELEQAISSLPGLETPDKMESFLGVVKMLGGVDTETGGRYENYSERFSRMYEQCSELLSSGDAFRMKLSLVTLLVKMLDAYDNSVFHEELPGQGKIRRGKKNIFLLEAWDRFKEEPKRAIAELERERKGEKAELTFLYNAVEDAYRNLSRITVNNLVATIHSMVEKTGGTRIEFPFKPHHAALLIIPGLYERMISKVPYPWNDFMGLYFLLFSGCYKTLQSAQSLIRRPEYYSA